MCLLLRLLFCVFCFVLQCSVFSRPFKILQGIVFFVRDRILFFETV